MLAGMPGFCLDGAQRSPVHQLDRGTPGRVLSSVTAVHAASRSLKTASALALHGCSGTVR